MDAASKPDSAPVPGFIVGQASADGKLKLYGYKQTPPQPLSPPHIVDLKPLVLTLEPRRFSWCSCGYSKNQPFCDDSHRLPEYDTNRRSYKFEALEAVQVAFCLCKHTGNPPYCDGTCKTLARAALTDRLPTRRNAALRSIRRWSNVP